jgi:hypothetical protein
MTITSYKVDSVLNVYTKQNKINILSLMRI